MIEELLLVMLSFYTLLTAAAQLPCDRSAMQLPLCAKALIEAQGGDGVPAACACAILQRCAYHSGVAGE